MKILLLTQQLGLFRSGVGTYAASLAAGLRKRGHRVTVALPPDQLPAGEGIETLTVRPAPGDPTPGKWLSLGAAFASVVRRRHREFDIVHFTDAREAWLTPRTRTPMTGMANDSYALDWIQAGYPRGAYADRRARGIYYFIERRIEKATYRRLDALVANSRFVGGRVAAGYGIPEGRIRVVHYGLDAPAAPIAPLRLPGAPSLLFVGGNFQRKGLPLVIEAVACLAAAFPGIHLHVVGEDRNRPALAALAARRGVGARITFHGRQPNATVRRMLAGAEIFVLPSLTESFGLVYLEAMQAGTPVVATRIGGAREVFREDEEALFVHPERADQLARAIERIATDRGFREALGERGRRAASRLTADRMTEQTEAVWDSLRRRR